MSRNIYNRPTLNVSKMKTCEICSEKPLFFCLDDLESHYQRLHNLGIAYERPEKHSQLLKVERHSLNTSDYILSSYKTQVTNRQPIDYGITETLDSLTKEMRSLRGTLDVKLFQSWSFENEVRDFLRRIELKTNRYEYLYKEGQKMDPEHSGLKQEEKKKKTSLKNLKNRTKKESPAAFNLLQCSTMFSGKHGVGVEANLHFQTLMNDAMRKIEKLEFEVSALKYSANSKVESLENAKNGLDSKKVNFCLNKNDIQSLKGNISQSKKHSTSSTRLSEDYKTTPGCTTPNQCIQSEKCAFNCICNAKKEKVNPSNVSSDYLQQRNHPKTSQHLLEMCKSGRNYFASGSTKLKSMVFDNVRIGSTEEAEKLGKALESELILTIDFAASKQKTKTEETSREIKCKQTNHVPGDDYEYTVSILKEQNEINGKKVAELTERFLKQNQEIIMKESVANELEKKVKRFENEIINLEKITEERDRYKKTVDLLEEKLKDQTTLIIEQECNGNRGKSDEEIIKKGIFSRSEFEKEADNDHELRSTDHEEKTNNLREKCINLKVRCRKSEVKFKSLQNEHKKLKRDYDDVKQQYESEKKRLTKIIDEYKVKLNENAEILQREPRPVYKRSNEESIDKMKSVKSQLANKKSRTSKDGKPTLADRFKFKRNAGNTEQVNLVEIDVSDVDGNGSVDGNGKKTNDINFGGNMEKPRNTKFAVLNQVPVVDQIFNSTNGEDDDDVEDVDDSDDRAKKRKMIDPFENVIKKSKHFIVNRLATSAEKLTKSQSTKRIGHKRGGKSEDEVKINDGTGTKSEQCLGLRDSHNNDMILL